MGPATNPQDLTLPSVRQVVVTEELWHLVIPQQTLEPD